MQVCDCRKAFFEEELGKAKDKLAKEEKRRKRAKEEFTLLLRESRRLNYDTPWSEAQTLLDKEPEYKAVRPKHPPLFSPKSLVVPSRFPFSWNVILWKKIT